MAISPFDRILAAPALAFDDVMLVPALSNLSPRDVNLATRFSQNIPLHRPFAAMAAGASATKAAIALAQWGGIGILECDMAVSEQATRVSKVKKFQARIVRNVMTVTADTSVIEAREMQQRYDLSSIPVVAGDTRRLVGLVTAERLKALDKSEQTVGAVMNTHDLPVLAESEMATAPEVMRRNKWPCVIITDANGHCVGLISQDDLDKFEDYPHATMDDLGRLRVAAAICAGPDHYDRVDAMIDAGVDALYIDAAHGYSKTVLDMITHIRRQRAGHVDVVAGRVAMADAAMAMIDAGANGVCAGVDFSSCGAGMPNLTAIMHVADACSMHQIPVLSYDVTDPGQIGKAMAAGASSLLFSAINAEEVPARLKPMESSLRQAMCVTGCATMHEFHLRPRFIKI